MVTVGIQEVRQGTDAMVQKRTALERAQYKCRRKSAVRYAEELGDFYSPR
jgi:hypothetical protein